MYKHRTYQSPPLIIYKKGLIEGCHRDIAQIRDFNICKREWFDH